ncbi:lipoate--protein ligase family protein [Cohnella terricola]|uniref:Lipoate--protein ligase family protein n=2 Tax=Cohnella terricola TaxID=1289167 RepID=A0A559JNQ5_9BACL|nr:lipoate--protein ligase family protein [Cohnella terricola]
MRLLDRTKDIAAVDAVYPFALDELLGKAVGAGEPPVCHLWRHPRAFVIGSKDSRLPHAAEAVRRLEERGYSVLVRNSGGAAVPLDPGVVNLSLILPIDERRSQDFRADFERMYALIRRAAAEYGTKVDKGEVAGSFCPGDYDLSIDGLKFCGIAQRRQLRAMIIQAFVIVEGSGSARARLVKEFYDIAGYGAEPGSYPEVRPETMTSLEERSVTGLDSIETFAESITRIVRDAGSKDADAPLVLPDAQAIVDMGRELRARYPLP